LIKKARLDGSRLIHLRIAMTTDSLPTLGEPVASSVWDILAHAETLVYYDGPLVSKFVSTDGTPWMVSWGDFGYVSGKLVNRWVVLACTEELLQSAREDSDGFAGQLRAALLAANEVFLVDLACDQDNGVVAEFVLAGAKLPENLLPSA